MMVNNFEIAGVDVEETTIVKEARRNSDGKEAAAILWVQQPPKYPTLTTRTTPKTPTTNIETAVVEEEAAGVYGHKGTRHKKKMQSSGGVYVYVEVYVCVCVYVYNRKK